MYLKKALKPNGRIYLTIVEKYRDPKDGKSKDRPVKVIGYADEYLDKLFLSSENCTSMPVEL